MTLHKVLKYLAIVIGVIGLVLLARVVITGDEAIENSADLQSSVLVPIMYLSYFVILAVLVLVGISVVKDLINGDIDIKKYDGDMDLRTINGEIDLVLKNTRLVAETIHGNIYADEGMDLNISDRYVGQKVEGRFDNATHRLKLNTINGNMYLRL